MTDLPRPEIPSMQADATGRATGAGVARHRTTAPATGAPPQVTRGERVAEFAVRDGQAVEIPGRRGWGNKVAFVDWVNVTVAEESFYWGGSAGVPVTDDQVIVEVSARCEAIFGFGITLKRDRGANFYRNSYELGDSLGLVCYGGQRGTVLISVSGEGCAVAKEGWEKRLYDFLETAVRPKITRVDLAHDDYEGKRYDVDRANGDYEAGLFNCGGRTPDCEQRGNWKRPNGKGRSFYVGRRTNGKFLRVYEKGKQLGNPDSPWVRIEGELKGVDRDIPFEVLLKPGAYLAAMFPALAFLQTEQQRIETRKKEAQFSYSRMVEWLHRQCGAALWVLSEVEGAAEALAKVMRPGDFPRSLKGAKSCESGGVPIHKDVRVEFAPGRFVQFA